MLQIKKANEDQLRLFFQEQFYQIESQPELIEHGYIAQLAGRDLGFFALIPVNEQSKVLRSFYIKQGNPPSAIIMLLDGIKQHALSEGVDNLLVTSHSKETDRLLEAHQFTPLESAEVRKDGQTYWQANLKNTTNQ
ncbi:hypothetical protein RZN22_12725 [Bacillaceae bacterium S4-13-58]